MFLLLLLQVSYNNIMEMFKLINDNRTRLSVRVCRSMMTRKENRRQGISFNFPLSSYLCYYSLGDNSVCNYTLFLNQSVILHIYLFPLFFSSLLIVLNNNCTESRFSSLFCSLFSFFLVQTRTFFTIYLF